MENHKCLHLYYGKNQLESLTYYQSVVLQANHYTKEMLVYLCQKGVQPLAYLSLGEISAFSLKTPVNWQRDACNPYWKTLYVHVNNKHWQANVLAKAEGFLKQGFTGFLLDNLDVVDLFPEDKEAMSLLIASLRDNFKTSYLLANRGFSLLPEFLPFVDGVLFEAFSTRWHVDRLGKTFYQRLVARDLKINADRAKILCKKGLDLYTLDYSDSSVLTNFARARAKNYGLNPIISNRYITKI